MCDKIKKGDIVKGKEKEYLLIKLIGEGGNGYVWQAECDNMKYAMKVLKKSNKEKETRFLEEIKFSEETFHENIIKVLDNGKFKDQFYYVMPFYSKTLRNVIKDNNISYSVILEYIEKLCEAIKYIHDKNIIHRDIKPENIFIEGDKLVLADFGIAHFNDSTLTKDGDLLANRNYLAPEQKIKNNSKNIDNSADIYALGVIINECFTKQNPAGSQFKYIEDFYPVLEPLDKLVYRMMKQNYNERPKINEIILEIKFLKGELVNVLEDIKENNELFYDTERNEKIIEEFLNTASEDILIAKYIFENKSNSELEKYNHNYHMYISYYVDELVRNLYFQELLYNICMHSFNYESQIYKNGLKYLPLDLENKQVDIEVYEKFKGILNNYPVCYEEFDLTGKILKMFSSCCDYHCKEIIDRVENRVYKQVNDLSNSPILYIVIKLKMGIIENKDILRRLHIEERIFINWEKINYVDYSFKYEANNMELFRKESYEEEKNIFSFFESKWSVVYNQIDIDKYSVKFISYYEYSKFKDYALKISKPYYIFEGDVLSFIRIERVCNGIVELKILNSFDIKNTLAKILGLRCDY